MLLFKKGLLYFLFLSHSRHVLLCTTHALQVIIVFFSFFVYPRFLHSTVFIRFNASHFASRQLG